MAMRVDPEVARKLEASTEDRFSTRYSDLPGL